MDERSDESKHSERVHWGSEEGRVMVLRLTQRCREAHVEIARRS